MSGHYPYPKVIAHRGASATAPENTLAAFKLAQQMGAVSIETDVMLTKDEQLILMHDDSLKRFIGEDIQVGLTDWSELKKYNIAAWKKNSDYPQASIAKVEALLQLMRETGLAANLEVKPYTNKHLSRSEQKKISRRTAELLLKAVRDDAKQHPKWQPEIVFSSFDLDALDQLVELQAEWPLGLLLDSWPKNVDQLLKRIKPCSVHLNKTLATEKRVKNLKQQGYKVLTYTVNKPDEAEKLYALGVDGVFSDYPDLLD